ncbi:MAG: SDR family oxidoreductase [Flavobacteriales bacterium]|nr:SDR family oxidoreductase [Flavobacteriales bacterium]MCB9447974.1 SDR family oxidoreductase [Flavobacteriales bacterium]
MKTALITGANRGIGLEICRQLAMNGFTVVMGCRDVEKGKQAAAELPGVVQPIELDVSTSKSVRKAAEEVRKKYGRLDVLINNAGISKASKGILDTSMDEIKEMYNVNFYGAIRMVKFFYPLLSESDDARIINMSSGMGSIADLSGSYAAYRLSKASLNALTMILAKELSHVVSVYAMCPGWVRTDMGGKSAIRSVEEGAETAIWLATEENIPSGKFYRDKHQIPW